MNNNPFNAINPANPLNNNRVGQMKNIMNLFRNSNNPMALFQQMAMNNPQMQPFVNALRNGANPNELFNRICQQRGINPEDLKKMLRK